MPVAKTYESLEMQGEPFKENGRMYVNVMTSKGLKKVRWYSDNEYQRMYQYSFFHLFPLSLITNHNTFLPLWRALFLSYTSVYGRIILKN